MSNDYDYNNLGTEDVKKVIQQKLYVVPTNDEDKQTQEDVKRKTIYNAIQDFLVLNINKSIYVDFARKHKDVFMGEFNKNIRRLTQVLNNKTSLKQFLEKNNIFTSVPIPNYILNIIKQVDELDKPDPVKNPTENDLTLLEKILVRLQNIIQILNNNLNNNLELDMLMKKKKIISTYYINVSKSYYNKLNTLYEIIYLNENTVNNITETQLTIIKSKVYELINSTKNEDSILIELQLLNNPLKYLTHPIVDNNETYEYVLFFTDTNDINTLKGYFSIYIENMYKNEIKYYNFNQNDMDTIKRLFNEDEQIPIRIIPRNSKL